MAQGVLSFKYEGEKKDTGMTAMAGLPVYLDLTSVMGLNESIEKYLHIKQQGWTDSQTLMSLILMNLAGGGQLLRICGNWKGMPVFARYCVV